MFGHIHPPAQGFYDSEPSISQLSCGPEPYLMSGFDTISMRPIPALFKSIDKSRRRGSNIDFPVSW